MKRQMQIHKKEEEEKSEQQVGKDKEGENDEKRDHGWPRV